MNVLMCFMADGMMMVRGMDAHVKDVQVVRAEDPDIVYKFIRCPECGEQIQMVPALADMIAAIEDHISIHRENAKSSIVNSQVKTPCIRENLTEGISIQDATIRETPKDSAWIKLE